MFNLEELTNQFKKISLDKNIEPFDAAVALLAMTSIENSEKEKVYLYKIVSGKDMTWIREVSLQEVAIRLHAIYQFKPGSIRGADYAELANRLINAETEPGGPYRASEKDAFTTNALIAQLFVSLKTPLPKINTYLLERIKIDPQSSFDKFSIWAASWPNELINISRGYGASKRNRHNPIRDYAIMLTNNPPALIATENQHENRVVIHIANDIENLDINLKLYAEKIFHGVKKADKDHEISMLSKVFMDSLDIENESDDHLAHILGVSNFYAWIAYTIYDDFIDDEGDSQYLPIANLAHRLSLQHYLSVANTPKLEDVIFDAYYSVDAANAWELQNCRAQIKSKSIYITSIPHYGDGDFLARRAIGHILGPIIITQNIDSLTKKQKIQIKDALKHYLIARQINDDMHDWLEDLQNGHLSFVVSYLLKSCGIKNGKHSLKIMGNALKTYFWRHGIEDISKIVITHTEKSKEMLMETGLMKVDSAFVSNFIQPIEDSARDALLRHQDQLEFLKSYNST